MNKNSQNIILITVFTALWILFISLATFSFDLFKDPITFLKRDCSFENIGGMAFLTMLIFCLDIAIEMIFSLKGTDTHILQRYPLFCLILFVLVGLLVYLAININSSWSSFVLIIGINGLMFCMKWGYLYVSVYKKANNNLQERSGFDLEEFK